MPEPGSRGPWSRGPADELSPLEETIVRHFFVLAPSYAVFLGLHEYDGRLPELSTQATDRWARQADALRAKLNEIPEKRLSSDRAVDQLLLNLLLESALFDLREAHDYERNPMAYIGPISLTPYITRDYSPLPARVEAMERLLRGVSDLLETGRRRLSPPLPEPFVRLSLAMSAGLPSHFTDAENVARAGSAALGDQLQAARGIAGAALTKFVGWLRDEVAPKASPEFALGPEKFQKLLWVREGIRTPFAEILARGRADLERNQSRLSEIAAARRPRVSVADLLEGLYRDHAAANGLLPEAKKLVDETKRFVVEHRLVSVPEPATCRVEETPSYGRALSTASMNPPGPFDTGGEEGIYYVTPVDPAWSAERQEQWLRSLNRAMLRNITVHEVFPGHYLQFLHFRRQPSSLTRKVFLSAAFTEGWAHYAEQLAIESGLQGRSAEAEAAQLHDALLRNCRLVAAIRLHTQGMTLEEATQLFMKEAHMERLPSEREAIRGTFNPEYFCYTLGKLAILDARKKLLAKTYRNSLESFHDRLLSFGSPPVGLLETLLARSS
jgi:uncharacterized protein DUF885